MDLESTPWQGWPSTASSHWQSPDVACTHSQLWEIHLPRGWQRGQMVESGGDHHSLWTTSEALDGSSILFQNPATRGQRKRWVGFFVLFVWWRLNGQGLNESILNCRNIVKDLDISLPTRPEQSNPVNMPPTMKHQGHPPTGRNPVRFPWNLDFSQELVIEKMWCYGNICKMKMSLVS